MKFEFNWVNGVLENCFNLLMRLQYERPKPGRSKVYLDLWNLFIAIVSLC